MNHLASAIDNRKDCENNAFESQLIKHFIPKLFTPQNRENYMLNTMNITIQIIHFHVRLNNVSKKKLNRLDTQNQFMYKGSHINRSD